VGSSFRSAAIVSYRLGGLDGVSVEAAKWAGALDQLGMEVITVAGDGHADYLVEGLGMVASQGVPPTGAVDETALRAALADAEVVVADNICSLPLNPAAGRAVAHALAGRPAVLRHHDLGWQRANLAHFVPDDPCWAHVTINDLSRRQLAQRGIAAATLRNRFDTSSPPGDGEATRRLLGIDPGERLALQPTRAIARKNVALGVALAEAIDARYWLTGPAEEGWGPELAQVLGSARIPVLHRPAPGQDPERAMADAYAACDVVLFPSTWEGFGNPVLEAAIHRRPIVVGAYPVAAELEAFGFHWFGVDDLQRLGEWLEAPDPELLEANASIAARHFSLTDLPDEIETILASLTGRGAVGAGPAGVAP
jgi:glycosyltransferase involved in cell wall biosynthesis